MLVMTAIRLVDHSSERHSLTKQREVKLSLGLKPKAIARSASGTKFLWSKLVDDIDLLWDRCVYVINELMNSKLA